MRMGSRIGFWVGGSIMVGLASRLIPWGAEWQEVGPLLMALVVVVAGSALEIASLGFIMPAPRVLKDSRPADGEVGIAPMAAVRGEPNPHDPSFLRFVEREPSLADAGAARLEPRPGGRAAPQLLGRVVLISIFLGRDGKAWSDAEIAEAHDALIRAGCWIEREAIHWKAPVNIELADTYFVAQDDTPDEVEVNFVPQGEQMHPQEAQATLKALTAATRAAVQLGFHDAADLVARINARVEADVHLWLLHPRRAGCSLAVALDTTELAGVSLAVCYAREATFPEPLTRAPRPDPVTFAHEALHLFGAEDKYGLPLRSFPPGSVTARDIMRLNEMPLTRYRIDLLTASEIGWSPRG
jgi:hypothetical protein